MELKRNKEIIENEYIQEAKKIKKRLKNDVFVEGNIHGMFYGFFRQDVESQTIQEIARGLQNIPLDFNKKIKKKDGVVLC